MEATARSVTMAAAVSRHQEIQNHHSHEMVGRKEDAALQETRILAIQVCNLLI